MSQIYKWLISLFVSMGFASETSSRSSNIGENALIIRQTIQELNETVFASRSIRIELLKNCPEFVPVLADWEYEAWHSYNHSLERGKILESFNSRLNDDKVPFTIVALKETTLVGVISLEDHSESELSDLQDGNPWLESFHVLPAERNKGLGEELLKAAATIAKRLGYQRIHFYTSVRKNVPWYVKRGSEVVETRPYHDHVITVMKLPLNVEVVEN